MGKYCFIFRQCKNILFFTVLYVNKLPTKQEPRLRIISNFTDNVNGDDKLLLILISSISQCININNSVYVISIVKDINK